MCSINYYSKVGRYIKLFSTLDQNLSHFFFRLQLNFIIKRYYMYTIVYTQCTKKLDWLINII